MPGSGTHPPGQTYFLGRYRVVDEIGIGGMASVHLARMDGPGGFQKWVAIKRIHPHLVEDDSFITMFLDEARVAARISHPNVATVFELGKEADSFWIAMEYLHGEPLREIMRRTEELGTPMPPEIACRVIADAAEGLHAAHELLGKNGEKLNLVHRDVTPHNLFVTYDGATKVVDFGIAKFSSRMASTRAGTLKGKLAYMSPEQVAGEPIDRRTDIFALGVVLWELTTGQRLFRMDSDLDTLAKVQDCNVPRPSTIVRGYPLELERVVLKALAKNKNERYRTAREFSRALQSMLMKRGLFIASDEVSAYVRSIFGDRIQKREAHLRWAAEVTQTGEAEGKALVPDFEGSVQSYDSDVQKAMSSKPPLSPTAAARPAPPRVDLKSTMPLPQRSPVASGAVPRPAAGLPPRPMMPPPPAAPPPAQMSDLDSMEDDGPTIMAPTPTDEEYDEDQDATIVAEKPSTPAAAPAASARAPVVRPAAGAPAPMAPQGDDDDDATRAQPLPPMNAAQAVPPRRAPARMPDQPQGPPVVVAPPPMQTYPQPQFNPAAYAPTYSPGDPRLAPPPAFAAATGPYSAVQQPTMVVQRTGVPMWVVGVASGVAALMVLFVIYLLAVPPHPAARAPVADGTMTTTGASGPFGGARTAFTAALAPSASVAAPPASTAGVAPPPSASVAPVVTASAAPTATVTATATATAVVRPVPLGPTQIASSDKGFLTIITVPRCDAWSDNGTPMGTCPITNKPLPVGSHRITLTTKAPRASKTISVIILSGQLANPGLVMLGQ